MSLFTIAPARYSAVTVVSDGLGLGDVGGVVSVCVSEGAGSGAVEVDAVGSGSLVGSGSCVGVV